MSWESGLLGGATGLLLLAVLSFARGYYEEWRRIRREYKLFRAMQQGDEKAGEEWYEMVKDRNHP